MSVLNKVLKNNIKKIALVGAIPFVMTACQKEGCTDATADNYNPKAEKNDGTCDFTTKNKEAAIAAQQIVVDNAANEVRAAVGPAKNGIENPFIGAYNSVASSLGKPVSNIEDSSFVFKGAIDKMHQLLGNPLPLNDAECVILYTKSDVYLAQLKKLRDLSL
jgi:hypothetical protein